MVQHLRHAGEAVHCLPQHLLVLLASALGLLLLASSDPRARSSAAGPEMALR